MFPSKLLIIATLANLPIVIMYSRVMWSRGHYQFFPLLFCAVAWLIFDRLSHRKPNANDGWWAAGLFAFNLLLLFLATAVYTPVLVIPAIVTLICAVVVARYGLSGLWAVIPVVGLLLIVTKLPTGRDLLIINQMQFLASMLASWILDAFGLIHFREGVILVTEKKQFFTEEACSGIRSLFSTLAAIGIYGLVRHYSFVRQFFNFAQSIIWVIVGNAIRVAAVVYLADNGYEQFGQGTLHEIFGLVIFVGIIGITLSVDRSLDLIFAKRDGDEKYTSPAPAEDVVDETKPPTVSKSFPRLASWGLIVLYFAVFLFSARLTYAKRSNFDKIDFHDSELLVAMEGPELPAQIEGWKLKGFESKLRTEASLFAPESFIWTYQSGPLKAIISLDSPYPEFHDLTLCYRGVGWNVKANHDYETDSQEGFSWLDMEKPTEFGRVLFAAYTSEGRLAKPGNEFSPTTRFVRNIELAVGKLAIPSGDVNRNGEAIPISQIQLMVRKDQPITETDMQSFRKLFEISRNTLLKSKRFGSGNGSTAATAD